MSKLQYHPGDDLGMDQFSGFLFGVDTLAARRVHAPVAKRDGMELWGLYMYTLEISLQTTLKGTGRLFDIQAHF